MLKPYLEAGEFVTTHGVEGELRLYPHADSPAFLTQFDTFYKDPEGGQPLRVVSARVHKNICLIKLEGVDSIESARPYIGRRVYISRADAQLPEGRFFVQDLLGARVEDARTGQLYGTIKSITRPGRHDVYEIEQEGQVFLFPAAEPFVEKIDIEGGVVRVLPIEGMFEPPDAKEERQP